MVNVNGFDTFLLRNRWVAFIDILGISALTLNRKYIDVFGAMEATRKTGHAENIIHSFCFSDTIVFYTEYDTAREYDWLQLRLETFLFGLTIRKIAFCGSLTYGELYADRDREIYFGPAFIESYKNTEGQDWLGMTLAPSAEEYLRQTNRDPSGNIFFKRHRIPFKHEFIERNNPPLDQFAFFFLGPSRSATGFDVGMRCLMDMKIDVLESSINLDDKNKIARKYDRCIEFQNLAPENNFPA